jgi:tRNA-dihydrouridine synthase B
MLIGNISVKGSLFLAPMSNITSLPFRLMCKRYGASVVYSEMINADAFIIQSLNSNKRAYFLEEERPIGIQLSGSDVQKLVKAAIKIEAELKPDFVDINIGCPAYNVMKTGAGANLLQKPLLVREIVSKLSESLSLPLTCKIRILSDHDKTLKLVKIIEKSGAKAITIHARTAKQKYSGKADWSVIKKAKAVLKIPVVLNGDITDELSAEKAFKTTGCDAVMIGRAAVGNPYIFRRISHYLEGGNMLPKQDIKKKIEDFLEFISLCKEYDFTNIISIKIQAQDTMKGFIGSNAIRNKLSSLKSIEEIERFMSGLKVV